ncbi:ParA family protein [Deinococcus aquaedulcis]|uniref:ParA family protein n=1 Tax=Deinococcus aquaedulcis TaxID=2840455 RepID=UPI001C83535E|nr:ParA family protein [Deinococcus aquaedulcis]
MKVVAITSEKGGVGKSTLAVHLAGAAHAQGLTPLLVDEDGRVGSSLRWARRAGALPFEVVEADDVRPKKLARYDLLLLDTEGRPKRKELRQLAGRADLLLVPSGVSALELDATRELLDFLHEEGAARKTRVVLTRVPPVGHAAEEAREDLREAGLTVCNTVVRQYAAFQRAAEAGVLVRDVPGERSASAWSDVLRLAQELW